MIKDKSVESDQVKKNAVVLWYISSVQVFSVLRRVIHPTPVSVGLQGTSVRHPTHGRRNLSPRDGLSRPTFWTARIAFCRPTF